MTEGIVTIGLVSMLKVEHVQISQSGQYKCLLKNLKGEDQRQFQVEVTVSEKVGKGIIAAIVIVILIVIVLLVILIRKVRQDKVIYSSN